MAFSLYQSMKTIPPELGEAARVFRLSAWQRFWRLELPYAMPALLWNMMMSMSGGWFFLVAAEAISVADQDIKLPGIGAYIAVAIEQKDGRAIAWAIGAMFAGILLYDQLFFRPLLAWADKFRFEESQGDSAQQSWLLDWGRRSVVDPRADRPLLGRAARARSAGSPARRTATPRRAPRALRAARQRRAPGTCCSAWSPCSASGASCCSSTARSAGARRCTWSAWAASRWCG